MDDFEEVIDLSFMDDSDDAFDEAEGNEGNSQGDHSTGTGPPLPLQTQRQAPLLAEHLTPSQDQDFQSQDQVVLRPKIGPGQDNIPEPRPSNVETEWMAQRGREGTPKCPECNHPTKRKDVRRIWSKSVVVADTAERNNAVAQVKKEQELRIRCEQDLNQSSLAYQMLKNEMTKLQKKHDRQRRFKIKYGRLSIPVLQRAL
ncbi:RING finger and WD repeat domain-containing protein 3 [Modicella reniformis]|uniref:RING finger and WD repeat domain-containing protein 3 n=1 Tax=Modicella reniformis TaxID=1440133 RepID=A0A9P6STD4_9FUNG|nr:RING finger and WD repeat domain-containing protein 3 [Modicella reniformis]